MTVNQVVKALSSGSVTMKELRKEYSRLRSIAQKRIGRIEKSAIPFTKGARPYFSKLTNIVTERDLVREYAELSRFIESPSSTAKGRREQREKTIDTLQKRGFDVDKSNYMQFLNFMEWFKHSEYAAKYDSNSDIVQEVFDMASMKAGSREWKKLFKALEKEGWEAE